MKIPSLSTSPLATTTTTTLICGFGSCAGGGVRFAPPCTERKEEKRSPDTRSTLIPFPTPSLVRIHARPEPAPYTKNVSLVRSRSLLLFFARRLALALRSSVHSAASPLSGWGGDDTTLVLEQGHMLDPSPVVPLEAPCWRYPMATGTIPGWSCRKDDHLVSSARLPTEMSRAFRCRMTGSCRD